MNGQGIHADYDLMCIILADRKGNMTYTLDVPSMKTFYLVQCMLNSMFGIDMIQHGPEFDPNWHGVGARENEQVLYFGPKGRYMQGLSTMRQRHEAH